MNPRARTPVRRRRLHALLLVALVALLFGAVTAPPALATHTVTITHWDIPFTAGSPPGKVLVDDAGGGSERPAGATWFTTIGFCNLIRLVPGTPFDTATATWKSWILEHGPVAAGFAFSGNHAFVRDSGDLERVDLVTNSRTRWPDGGGLSDLSLDAAGNVWTVLFGGQLQRLTPTGATGATVTRWQVSGFSFELLGGVSVHSNGRVYFSDQSANSIGELNPGTNAVRRWSLGAVGASGPRNLGVDGSGNVWVVASSGHVVRLKPSQDQLTTFAIPTAGSNPRGIAPNGAIGFTEETFPGKIGLLAPDGTPVVVAPTTQTVTPTTASINGIQDTVQTVTGTAAPTNTNVTATETGGFTELPVPGGSFFPRGIDHTPGSFFFGMSSNAGNRIGRVSDEAGQAVREVRIDIKPGSFPNSINLENEGVIPVAILTDPTFDATTVVPASVCFGEENDAEAFQRDCTEPHSTGPLWAGHTPTDVDGDGDLDMIFHFDTQETGIDPGDTSACLTGAALSPPVLIRGCDSVRTV